MVVVGLRELTCNRVAPFLAGRVSPILLFHATAADLPEELSDGVHNVEPDTLVEQVNWLRSQFEFISIDDWFARGRPMGTACVTFDDGYLSVFEEALPRLIEMGVPSTVFLNGSAFRGEVFWRDRVVFVVNHGLAEDFLASTHARAVGLDDIPPEHFYNLSRKPDRSSKAVDRALNDYLIEIGRLDEVGRHTVHDVDQLTDHGLVTYGCHTYRHYVPSSLSTEEQEEELGENRRLFDELDLHRSNIFSIPFGGLDAVDATTRSLVERFGFDGVLFSRHAVNFARPTDLDGFPAAERYMVPDSLRAFQERHVRLAAMDPASRTRRTVQRAADLVRR